MVNTLRNMGDTEPFCGDWVKSCEISGFDFEWMDVSKVKP